MTLGSGSALEIELGGTITGDEYDVVNVARNAALAGTLDLALIDGFEPGFGDVFTVMTFGGGQSRWGLPRDAASRPKAE